MGEDAAAGGARTTQLSTGGGRMSDQSKATGTKDQHYNLVSVLYHALQGGEAYDQYISDAEAAGDDELAQFFRDVQNEERQRAERAKSLLGSRVGGS